VLTFLTGVLLGALSGTATYLYSADSTLGALVGIVVMILAWCGVAAFIIIDGGE
jgi:hypothetical protein